MKMISKYVSYDDATKSATAIKFNIDNTPDVEQLLNIKAVAENIYDKLFEHFGKKIKIEAFFRCTALNNIISTSKRSQHTFGQAIDLDDDLGGIVNSEMFYWIENNLEFDQLIWEYGDGKNPAWVHVSYVREEDGGINRGKITLASKKTSPEYTHFTSIKDFETFKKILYK